IDRPTIQAALAEVANSGGIVEIVDNSRYTDGATGFAITIAADRSVELRAADGRRPTLVLRHPFVIKGGAGSTLALNGLLVSGRGDLVVPDAAGNRLGRLAVAHATLVPGAGLRVDGSPKSPAAVR